MNRKNSVKNSESLREKILKSMVVSFKIEGINISNTAAAALLKKVEFNLGK